MIDNINHPGFAGDMVIGGSAQLAQPAGLEATPEQGEPGLPPADPGQVQAIAVTGGVRRCPTYGQGSARPALGA